MWWAGCGKGRPVPVGEARKGKLCNLCVVVCGSCCTPCCFCCGLAAWRSASGRARTTSGWPPLVSNPIFITSGWVPPVSNPLFMASGWAPLVSNPLFKTFGWAPLGPNPLYIASAWVPPGSPWGEPGGARLFGCSPACPVAARPFCAYAPMPGLVALACVFVCGRVESARGVGRVEIAWRCRWERGGKESFAICVPRCACCVPCTVMFLLWPGCSALGFEPDSCSSRVPCVLQKYVCA